LTRDTSRDPDRPGAAGGPPGQAEPARDRVSAILDEIEAGSPRASEDLLPLVYDELRLLARSWMARERVGQTLQPTGLVHEAYLRLVAGADRSWDSKGHFFAAAATAMRRILIERARRYARPKHGGHMVRVTLGDARAPFDAPIEQIIDLDRALTALHQRDDRMAKVAELRYFVGLGVDETAQAMGVSPRTVHRLWEGGRTWLHREMQGHTGGAPPPV
jgi:RNA polymerase sigma factor (TIGR02999 family)